MIIVNRSHFSRKPETIGKKIFAGKFQYFHFLAPQSSVGFHLVIAGFNVIERVV